MICLLGWISINIGVITGHGAGTNIFSGGITSCDLAVTSVIEVDAAIRAGRLSGCGRIVSA